MLHYAFVNLSSDMRQLLQLIFLGPVLRSIAPKLLIYWGSQHFGQRYQSNWQLFFCFESLLGQHDVMLLLK